MSFAAGFVFRAFLSAILTVPGLGLPPSGPDQMPEPRTYEAWHTNGPITIDGDMGDAAWSAAPWTEDFVDIRGTVPGPDDSWSSPSLRTRVKILWNDACLFIAAEMEEPHLWATLEERDAIIYRDDDFEVFLDPDGDGLAYFELEINALGTEMDLYLDKPYRSGGRARIGWDMAGLRTAVSLRGTLNDPSDLDGGWSVEMAIPWKALVPPDPSGTLAEPDETRISSTNASTAWLSSGPAQSPGEPPNIGDIWRMNFSRVDWPIEVLNGRYRKAREPSRGDRHPESNWTWSPQGAVDMHLPERWGVVRFVEDPQNSLLDKDI